MCERLKAHLVLHGLEAVREHESFSTHLACCPRCAAVVAAYDELPGLLAQLPEHEPDAALVKRTGDAVAAEMRGPVTGGRRRRQIAGGLAAVLVAVAALGLFRQTVLRDGPTMPAAPSVNGVLVDKISAPAPRDRNGPLSTELRAGDELGSKLQDFGQTVESARPPRPAETGNRPLEGDGGLNLQEGESSAAPARPTTDGQIAGGTLRPAGAGAAAPAAADGEFRTTSETRGLDQLVVTGSRIGRGDTESPAPAFSKEGDDDVSGAPESELDAGQELGDGADPDSSLEGSSRSSRAEQKRERGKNKRAEFEEDAVAIRAQVRRPEAKLEPAAPEDERLARESISQKPKSEPPEDPQRQYGLEAEPEAVKKDASASERPADDKGLTDAYKTSRGAGAYRQNERARALWPPAESPAAGFFGRYQQTEGLSFQDATGYWANTYVPGDPAIRLLNARLRDWDRSALAVAEELEQQVLPVRQPFDPPSGGALGLTVMADANAVEGPTRMRLQVGIRAIDHRRGQRPAMNVGVVVDLPPEASDDQRIAVRALLDALLKSKQAGDRFSLTATSGGLLVAADEFRFGPLEVAKRALLEPDAETDAEPMGLGRALETAATAVREGEDPSRPLGSSSVLLITAGELPLGSALEALRDRIHGYAGDGITLSVVPLGARPAARIVDALVLAGLGNRRILESPDQAPALIENELHAASRAVARAARLSIRLAPGVHLISVLGSERLDEPAAERVREIEQSMDLRLSSNLGIEADRGEDEDGIQIVIPSVYSGDCLTVLLDVVVERPGPVAEVSLRYKDLVFLNNGALHGQLKLPKGALDRGPAQLAVLKNLLAHHFVLAVEEAAAALAGGEPAQAAAALERILAIIAGARAQIPAWRNDSELTRDERVLETYLQALASPEAGVHRTGLSDSLRFAAWRKAHRPPPEWQS